MYICVCVYIYHVFFIHSSVDGHRLLLFLAVVNNASVNIKVRISFPISVFPFFKYIPRCEMFILEQKVDLHGVTFFVFWFVPGPSTVVDFEMPGLILLNSLMEHFSYVTKWMINVFCPQQERGYSRLVPEYFRWSDKWHFKKLTRNVWLFSWM